MVPCTVLEKRLCCRKRVPPPKQLSPFPESSGDLQVSGASVLTKVLGSIPALSFLNGFSRFPSFLLTPSLTPVYHTPGGHS